MKTSKLIFDTGCKAEFADCVEISSRYPFEVPIGVQGKYIEYDPVKWDLIGSKSGNLCEKYVDWSPAWRRVIRSTISSQKYRNVFDEKTSFGRFIANRRLRQFGTLKVGQFTLAYSTTSRIIML